MDKRLKLVFLIIPLIASACAGGRKMAKTFSGEPGEIVIVEGISPIVDGNSIDARKAALADAQKNAVEMVVGVYVSAKTRVEKALTIESQIVSRTQGYIDSYEILEEKKDSDFYRVKIKALVKLDDISSDLKDLGLVMQPGDLKNPKVAVLIEELLDGEEQVPSEAESAVINELLNKGYSVVESSDLSNDELEGIASGQERYYKGLSDRLNVEVLVVGKSESTFFTDANLGGFISYRATLQARVIKAQTGEILMSVSQQASDVDVVKHAAGKKALARVGEVVGKELAGQIAGKLRSYSTIGLSLKGIDTINELNNLINYVRKESFVEDILINNFSNKQGFLSVKLSSGDTKGLAQVLEKYPSAIVKIISLSNYQISAEMEVE